MKKMPKKLFDEIVSFSRSFWRNNSLDGDVLRERIKAAQELCQITGVEWCALIYFVDALLMNEGFMPDAPNEMLYHLLGQLGWEITDEIEEIESV